ncbi:redoxin domain-containing protein [Caulobacter sp.]|uniref:redoxin domain-containing protein n=1 Tax=Caulobacter sp. TaxID=78 RepID=UPI003BA94122
MSFQRKALISLALGAVVLTGGLALWAKDMQADLSFAGEASASQQIGRPAPSLDAAEGWINSAPLSLQALRGKPMLIDFWTYACVNCVRTLPHLRRWHETYGPQGLTVIGVHSPEFPFERSERNVAGAARRLKVGYPIALDPAHKVWDAYDVRAWPTLFLVDRAGRIVFVHEGEGDYDAIERQIQQVLAQ